MKYFRQHSVAVARKLANQFIFLSDTSNPALPTACLNRMSESNSIVSQAAFD